jgi:hypothetical protein
MIFLSTLINIKRSDSLKKVLLNDGLFSAEIELHALLLKKHKKIVTEINYLNNTT